MNEWHEKENKHKKGKQEIKEINNPRREKVCESQIMTVFLHRTAID